MGLRRRPLPKKTGNKRKRALDVEDRQLVLEKKGMKKQKKLEYNAKLAEANKKQQAIRVAGSVHTQDIIRALSSKPLSTSTKSANIDVSSVLSALGVGVPDFGWSSDEAYSIVDEEDDDESLNNDQESLSSVQESVDDEPVSEADDSNLSEDSDSNAMHKRVSFPSSTEFTDESDSFFSSLMHGKDVVMAVSDFTGPVARSTYSVLSAYLLSHALKAGDKVRRNNRSPNPERDQGPTRPRICVVCPFRSNGYEIVRNMASFIDTHKTEEEDEEEEKVKKGLESFLQEYEGQDEQNIHSKNWESWRRELFKGHYDDSKYDDFVVGISFSFGKLKLSFPKNSVQLCKNIDIIIGTPLGLSRIAASDFKANRIKQKNSDDLDEEDGVVMDFLASIEILVVDRIDALMMQNESNTLDIIRATNQRPLATISADIGRIELKFLDSKSAQDARQTVFISGSTLMDEYMGFVHPDRLEILSSPSKGISLNKALCQKIKQQFFVRVPLGEEEEYFKNFFWKKVGNDIRNLIIVVAESDDFKTVQEFLQDEGLVNCYLSEETLSDIAGKRRKEMKQILKSFKSGDIRTIVITERLLWYQRIRITHGRHVFFYGPPKTDSIYADILADMVDPFRCSATLMYSNKNKLEIERIAGSKNLDKLFDNSNTGKTTVFTP